MPALDPKRLIELLRIAKHGSYTRAAAAQGVAQPALSNSIAALEKALGVPVLEPNRCGTTLTDFGRLLAGHAAALDSVSARASEEVELMKLGVEEELIIGVSPIACVDIVPDAIARLRLETPNIAVRIHERPNDELIKALSNGEIDFDWPGGLQAILPISSARSYRWIPSLLSCAVGTLWRVEKSL